MTEETTAPASESLPKPTPDGAAAAAAAASTNTQGKAKEKKANKPPPAGVVIPPPKPKMTKAERRALQESQRAAKAGGGGSATGAGKPQQQQADASKPQPPAAAKAQQDGGGGVVGIKGAVGIKSSNTKTETGANTLTDGGKASSGATLQQQQGSKENRNQNTVSLVSHLTPYQDPAHMFITGATFKPAAATASAAAVYSNLHPAVIRLGYDYANGKIRGGNARCRAMLLCFHTVLQDFIPPLAAAAVSSSDQPAASQQQQPAVSNPPSGVGNRPRSSSSATASATVLTDIRQALDQQVLKPSFQYWTEHCRPHSVSMGNAFSFLKSAVAALDRDLPYDTHVRPMLQETVLQYIRERIDYADQAIGDLACEKLLIVQQQKPQGQEKKQQQRQGQVKTKNNARKKQTEEVLLTYGYAEVIGVVLRQAHESNKLFRVIIVDNRPLLEGRLLLEELQSIPGFIEQHKVTYILLNALTYVLQEGVTKVLLGASALMSDGSVLGRVGTASVALAAHAQHIPVLICSETYKISNRVQLESITANELGNPASLNVPGTDPDSNTQQQQQQQSRDHLQRLNLLYDLTPAAFVSGIVTELGIVPPTSVAVLLREMNQEFV